MFILYVTASFMPLFFGVPVINVYNLTFPRCHQIDGGVRYVVPSVSNCILIGCLPVLARPLCQIYCGCAFHFRLIPLMRFRINGEKQMFNNGPRTRISGTKDCTLLTSLLLRQLFIQFVRSLRGLANLGGSNITAPLSHFFLRTSFLSWLIFWWS
jgi:hypothetical protein